MPGRLLQKPATIRAPKVHSATPRNQRAPQFPDDKLKRVIPDRGELLVVRAPASVAERTGDSVPHMRAYRCLLNCISINTRGKFSASCRDLRPVLPASG
jgi:hypothetical protein